MINEYGQNSINKQTGRLDWIDIAKGIGILTMVLGHNIVSLQPIIFSFHMPLFFILAGYTIKKVNKEGILKATIKDFRRLIIPCIITRLIIFLGNVLINQNNIIQEIKVFMLSLVWGNHNGTLFGIGVPSIGRIWFLPALFWSKLIFRILMNRFAEKSRVIIILLFSFISMFMGMKGIILPQNFDMIFLCILFIEIGYQIKSVDLKKINSLIYIGLFGVWTYCCCVRNIWISMNMRSYPGYGLCVVVAISGCFCVFRFSIAIEKMKLSKVLMYFGVNSLILLCIQTISPYFFTSSNSFQRCLDMLLECLLVVCYVFIKNKIKSVILKN